MLLLIPVALHAPRSHRGDGTYSAGPLVVLSWEALTLY